MKARWIVPIVGLAVLAVLAVPVTAQLIRYQDEKGHMHFTNEGLDAVPDKYLDRATTSDLPPRAPENKRATAPRGFDRPGQDREMAQRRGEQARQGSRDAWKWAVDACRSQVKKDYDEFEDEFEVIVNSPSQFQARGPAKAIWEFKKCMVKRGQTFVDLR
jgi:arginyl-tRNA synthetase